MPLAPCQIKLKIIFDGKVDFYIYILDFLVYNDRYNFFLKYLSFILIHYFIILKYQINHFKIPYHIISDFQVIIAVFHSCNQIPEML